MVRGRVTPLVERVKKVRTIHGQIQRERRKGIRESVKLNGLRRDLAKAELFVYEGLCDGWRIEEGVRFSGRRISAKVLTYCFKNFFPSENSQGVREANYPYACTRIPSVLAFMKMVKEEYKGQRVLGIRGGSHHLGVVSGPCRMVSIAGGYFYSMFIPVEKDSFRELRVERKDGRLKGKWVVPSDSGEGEEAILIDEKIFYERALRDNAVWVVDAVKSGDEVLREKSALYLGNYVVSRRLKKEFVIPEIIVKADMPD